jgi:exodeoxyribonuclease VII large subunit
VGEETARVTQLRGRTRDAIHAVLDREGAALAATRSRPVLAHPQVMIADRREAVERLVERSRRCLGAALDRAADNLAHTRARVTSLSPAATLERGYAVVQRPDGVVVRRPGDVDQGDALRVRLAEGEIAATVA